LSHFVEVDFVAWRVLSGVVQYIELSGSIWADLSGVLGEILMIEENLSVFEHLSFCGNLRENWPQFHLDNRVVDLIKLIQIVYFGYDSILGQFPGLTVIVPPKNDKIGEICGFPKRSWPWDDNYVNISSK